MVEFLAPTWPLKGCFINFQSEKDPAKFPLCFWNRKECVWEGIGVSPSDPPHHLILRTKQPFSTGSYFSLIPKSSGVSGERNPITIVWIWGKKHHPEWVVSKSTVHWSLLERGWIEIVYTCLKGTSLKRKNMAFLPFSVKKIFTLFTRKHSERMLFLNFLCLY